MKEERPIKHFAGLALLAILVISGCSSSGTGADEEPAPDSAQNPTSLCDSAPQLGQMASEERENQVKESCVNATFALSEADPDDDSKWVYVSLATSSVVNPSNPDDSAEWDLAFQRSNIKLNGSSNGIGNVAAAGLLLAQGKQLTDVTGAPFLTSYEYHVDEENPEGQFSTGYVLTNLPGDSEQNEFGWYIYDPATHQVSSRDDVIYIIHTANDEYYAFQMRDWMNEAGTKGYAQFLSKKIEAPVGPCVAGNKISHVELVDGSKTSCADATSKTDWVYFNFKNASVVTPADPNNSTEWDIAFKRNNIKVNSGVSGTGNAAVAVLEEGGEDFDSLTQAPQEGESEYRQDAGPADKPAYVFGTYPTYSGDPSMVGIGWALYNPANFTLTPRDVVYVVRTADGTGYYKFQTITYYENTLEVGAGTSGFMTFHWDEVTAP